MVQCDHKLFRLRTRDWKRPFYMDYPRFSQGRTAVRTAMPTGMSLNQNQKSLERTQTTAGVPLEATHQLPLCSLLERCSV